MSYKKEIGNILKMNDQCTAKSKKANIMLDFISRNFLSDIARSKEKALYSI